MSMTVSGSGSALRRWFNNIRGNGTLDRAYKHASAAGHGIRQGGESVVIGAVLGAAHVELPHGLDLKDGKMPLDAIVGVAGMIGGIAMAHEEFGTDLRNAGAAALSVFSFRKTFDVLAKKKKAAGGKVGGVFAGELDQDDTDMAGEESALVQAAKDLW